jgi:molybdopterin converting factor small subunit
MKIHLFAVTRDIIGSTQYIVPQERLDEWRTVGDIRRILCAEFPELLALRSLAIAVNQRLADDTMTVYPHDEIALIPPASGG